MMRLIDRVKRVCQGLAAKGWRRLLLHHGLDIAKPDLEQELTKPLDRIDRQAPGFEDFSLAGIRGVEPGSPARSLLYHAFASPNVVADHAGTELEVFPSLAELEIVENYVFGVQPPSLTQLRAFAGGNIAVAVFAHEYRPAGETVHRRHADQCFSRTGISRVGTEVQEYDGKRRGFLPFVEKKPFQMRVLPARYAAYLVAQWKGSSERFEVMNHKNHDDRLEFWVPLQKLFDGVECLSGLDLRVTLTARHRNEKLRRIHLAWKGKGGWSEPDISRSPFTFEDGIATLATDRQSGEGLLCPVPHALVERAMYQEERLTFHVPPSSPTLSSSVYIAPEHEARNAPEFVHARHLVAGQGKTKNLNDEPDVTALVAAGGYRAQHYIDFTADGWIEASCPQIATDVPRFIPAYSLVTAPDFFVSCDQRDLLEWSEQSVPRALRVAMWGEPPTPLSDIRFPPNLALTRKFVKEDKTVSAVVSLASERHAMTAATRSDALPVMRHSHLPDAAAGHFDPGWDVSRGNTDGVNHLAAYGLGSPFPEDAKLCAALSTFWPAVAPDAARSFEPNPHSLGMTPTVAPLVDEELGVGSGTGWDGLSLPTVKTLEGVEVVEYPDIDHVDYVETAIAGKFSLALTGRVDTREYEARVLAMARAYRALGVRGGSKESQWRKKSQWGILSVLKVGSQSAELKTAQNATERVIRLPAYRFEVYRPGTREGVPNDVRKIRVLVRERATLFVDETQVVLKRGALGWQSVDE